MLDAVSVIVVYEVDVPGAYAVSVAVPVRTDVAERVELGESEPLLDVLGILDIDTDDMAVALGVTAVSV